MRLLTEMVVRGGEGLSLTEEVLEKRNTDYEILPQL